MKQLPASGLRGLRSVPLLVMVVITVATCGDSPSIPLDEGPGDPLEDVPADTDLVFLGGPILTIENGVAEALAVRGNRILAVGDAEEIVAAASAPRVVNLAGAALLPGFIDGHIHMIRNAGRQGLTGSQAVEMALRYGLTTLAEVAGHMPAIENVLALEAAGELGVRVVAYGDFNGSWPGEDGKSIFVGTWYPDNPPLVDPARRLWIPGIKIFVDGAFSNDRGCYAMSEPYEEAFLHDPDFPCPDPRGSLFLDAEELADIIVEAKGGRIPGCHARDRGPCARHGTGCA